MATVFISYAHEDAELARYVANSLRAAGHQPWLDEENLVAGQHLEEALEAAVASADCGVFLIGWDWIRSLYGRKEIQLFALRDNAGAAVSRIGVLRLPREEIEAKLPAQLSFLVTEEWIDADADPEIAIWRLCCAVSGTRPGPRDTWKEQGRKLAAGPPPAPLLPVTDPRSTTAIDVAAFNRPSLFCDRAEQWNRIETTYPQAVHHLLLIAGARCEAHDYFVARIEQHLKKEPPHERVRVDWRLRPVGRDSYREQLARALGTTALNLSRVLRERMAHRNLILIHPVIDDDYDDESLVEYHTRWFPELLAEAHPTMRLKSIQPVSWSAAEGMTAVMRKMFGEPPEWLQREDEKEARALLAGMQNATAANGLQPLTTVRIDLGPITEKHITLFCDDHQLPPPDRESLLEEIRSAKRASSREILTKIDEFMRRRREGERRDAG